MDCLREFRDQKARAQKYKDYYEGNHKIINDYAMAESRSNMRVVVNFFKKFINDEIAYSLGHPVNFVHKDGDEKVLEAIDLNFSHWSKVHDQELMKQANIYGESYELEYIKDGEFRATVLTPMNAFVLESGTAEKEVILALHVYKEHEFTDVEKVDVYHKNKVYRYIIGGSGSGPLQYVDEKDIIFKSPPVQVCEANGERASMLDDIKSENDAYNNVISDLVNEVSDFRQAFLKIVGATMSEEEAKKMKKSGILQVNGQNVDIGYLVKEINDTFVQNLLSTLEEKIYKLASHIDTNEKLQSNLSGTALRSRMIALENKCTLMQSMLEKTIKQRLKNFFRYLKIKTGMEFDYRKVQLKFTMNIPSDLNLLADTISKLVDIVPQEILLSWIPSIENPKLAMEMLKNEAKDRREGMVDLDNLGLNQAALQTGDGNGAE